jgi:hypothetical protein
MASARFQILHEQCSDRLLVIRDVGPWSRHRTVTNDAEAVVRDLTERGYLRIGVLGELQHNGQGRFTGFAPVKAEGIR